jgi:hypothetical protein
LEYQPFKSGQSVANFFNGNVKPIPPTLHL